MAKKCILLINLGTPDSTAVKDVRKYLREFLMDRRVIDIPFLQRFLLVNGIIAPFRAPKSAAIYEQVWTQEGSPLKVYGFQLKEMLQKALGDDYHVAFAMRYQSPGIDAVLNALEPLGIDELLVVPLYPQYASSTTGSTIEKVFQELNKWENIPEVKVINQFLEDPFFVESCKQVAEGYLAKKAYDHYVFSYHGLPERQIRKASRDSYCQLNEKCCASYHGKNKLCYRAQCFQTTRLLAKALNLKDEDVTVCFQSRLGKDSWIRPYLDDAIDDITKKGKKRVLAFSPSFVADCLETTIEIGVEYKKIFLNKGGDQWDLVESLNIQPVWIDCLRKIITKNI